MSRRWAVLALLGAVVAVGPATRIAGGHEPAHHGPAGHRQGRDHGRGHEEGAGGHVHAPVPPEYRDAHVPAAAWTSPRMIARGREIHGARCAVCHGDDGSGKGPAALALPVRPPDFRDARMVGEMAGNYWFWRVSEGAAVEPFRSMGSVMPAWKDVLSVEDRWAVIAYQHTLSGHRGPHVPSEHPALLGPVPAPRHETAGRQPAGGGAAPGSDGDAARPHVHAPGAHKH